VTDGDALLAAILAAPDEDTPRLMYADWLDENAREVECRACLGSGSHALDPYELAARFGRGTATRILDAAKCLTCGGSGREQDERGLRAWWIRHSITSRSRPWDGDAVKRSIDIIQGCPPGSRLPRRVLWGPHELLGTDQAWSFDRGFVAEVRCPLAAWEKHGPAVVRRHPVRVVRLTDRRTWPANSLLRVYIWFSADFDETSDPPSVIPDPYFAAMWDAAPATDRHQDQTNPAHRWLSFHTEADAHAALSRGLIAWAKSQPA